MTRTIRSLLVANRSEIAIRVFRAATELGLRTIAIYSREDRFALHRFKADESYQVGSGGNPIGAYLDIDEILRVAREAGADAIHPGYGFLAENPDFADACRDAGLIFVGPPSDVMRRLGNKVAARELAESAGVPVMPATGPLPRDLAQVRALADGIGYPLMLKASWGGGGRGMRVIESADALPKQLEAARREAASAFGNDEVYLEKLVRHARHVEVQLLGDEHGNLVHLFERDCTVQRRHQKVVERAPAPYFDEAQREALCAAALRLGRAAGYVNAGTVEFLQDQDSGEFYFIEVNPRVQVEHTVTEEVTGVDIVQAQLRVARGEAIGSSAALPDQPEIRLNGHALQARITTENPENNFVPDYGRISTYRSASGHGIRLDGGTAFAGARVTPYYDSLLVKVTAWARTPEAAIRRMDRALREFRVRGVTTNLLFLENLINHPVFQAASYSTRFIDETPELFQFRRPRDRATRLLSFIGDVIVNGNADVRGRELPADCPPAPLPRRLPDAVPDGMRQRLQAMGAEAFSRWLREQQAVLLTDTTMRDAHQSLLATRMRTHDLLAIAPAYARLLPQMFSIECWGGATFDVAMRFLHEDPWERLAALRERMPNQLLQMLLRGANGVGYTNYPDNVVRFFIRQAAAAGIDVFRVFDSLNWVENMRVAMDAVRETGAICEGALCYTGDVLAARPGKYDLDYYLQLGRELKDAGAQIIGIKDMAGVCRPAAARLLVQALREETGLPVHFHTHDTSGVAAATVVAAVEAGADIVDGAIDSMSGLTSQPNLSSIVEVLADTDRDPGIDMQAMRELSHYWETVRRYYAPFESDIRSGTADVYRHAMPGGQYTNLREQARALGIEDRWPEVAETYAVVNELFGDIPKVTPSSKVVGDMALFMVTSGLTAADVLDPEREIDFPESVVGLFRGDLGQPPGGFPESLQRKVLKGAEPLRERPGATLPALDLDEARAAAAKGIGRQPDDHELAAYLMYPKVFREFVRHRQQYGDVSALPTPVFFYGMDESSEVEVEIEEGKRLVIRYFATSEPDADGMRRVFFELNGQPRSVSIRDHGVAAEREHRAKADPADPSQLGAPMPGVVTSVHVQAGQTVERGAPLLSIEAMKMETQLHADRPGRVRQVLVEAGAQIDSGDLLLRVE
ncbi:MAG: pyruvate carboxylase [Gammaproteobacteria bacterium]|nr:MAG: pyruvate carboxylase [Gammaproteobacteria bacterium]